MSDIKLIEKREKKYRKYIKQFNLAINSMKQKGKFCNTSRNGTALARIDHLINNNIVIILPVKNSKKNDIDQIISYLNDTRFVIK